METAFNNNVASLNNSLLKNTLNPNMGVVKSGAALTAKAEDSLSIGIMSPEKTQAILNRELADKLEQRFKEEGIELKGLKAEDFTPEKVSERIMSFVSGRILSEQDGEKQQRLMEQARAGVEQGFAEARGILESLNVLNGQVKEDIDTTYNLIQLGLDKLNQQINGETVDEDSDNDATESGEAVEQIAMQSGFSRSESTRVEILTNEGDKILVELFKNQSAEMQTRVQSSEDGSRINSSKTTSASVGISYQVQGDLNSEERKAIDDLLANVAKVSERFFSGALQDAFAYAKDMDFNTQELTRFSLDMTVQETRQLAINTYSRYQNPPETGNAEASTTSPALQDATAFIRQVDELLQNPFAQQNFAQPTESVSELIKAMNEQLYADSMQQLQQESADMLDSLVAQIKQFRGAESTVADRESQMVTG